MISETIDTINRLMKEGFDKKEAINIILINEIKLLRGKMDEYRRY